MERPIEELEAGNAFRDTLVKRADAWDGIAPLWHGWAIMDAFLAGIDYARGRQKVTPKMIEAGLRVLYEHDTVDGPAPEDSLVIAEIFRTMLSCRPTYG